MRFRRLMTALLVVTIVLVSGLFCACGQKADEPEVSPQETANNEVEEIVDPYGRYEEPITLTTVFVSSSATEEMIAGLGTDETLEDNRWTQLMKDELNINVEYTAVLDVSQYNEKVNIMIASGQAPDYLCQLPATTVKQMMDGGLIIPVRDLFDKWASDVNEAYHSINNYLNWSAFDLDGDYYAVPPVGEGDPLDSASVLWVRRDWLNNLNLSEPETLEDIDSIVEAFATGDPDQNGVDGDTLGLGLLGGEQFLDSALGYFNCNGAYPKMWLDEDGKLVKGLVLPEVKDTLTKLTEMYTEGYIDTEFSIKGVPQLSEDIANGKVGMFFGVHASPLLYGFAAEKALDPDADWIALPVPGKVGIAAPSSIVEGTVISKDCAHPEAVIKMMNVANKVDVMGDAETKSYYVTDAHNFVTPVKYPHLPMTNLYMALNTTKMLEGMDMKEASIAAMDEFYSPEDAAVLKEIYANETENIIYTLVLPYVEEQTPDNYPWYILFGPEGSEHVLRLYWDNFDDKLQQDMYLGPITELMSDYASTEQTMQDETFTRIIMGEDDISAFDTFLQDISAVGYTDIEQEVNDWYAQQAE